MNGLVGLFVLLVVALSAALVVVAARYAALRRDVHEVLERTNVDPRAPHASRALYRAVRGLEHEQEAATTEATRLREAVERTDLGLVITDRRGSITFTNPAASRILEGPHGNAVTNARAHQLIERVTTTGEAEELEVDLYTPTRRIVSLRALPFAGEDDQASGVFVYIVDHTDRYHLETVRRDFVVNAGHELKTPIGALSLLAETLTETDDPETRRRLSQRMMSESSRVARVVDDILTLAAVESLDTPHTEVLLTEVLEEAERAVAVGAEEKGIAVVSEYPEQRVLVTGDRTQLVSAFTNLLDNAVKYTTVEPGTTETVWLRARSHSGDVLVEVEDRGIGISDLHIDRVFERFYRVDRARSRTSGGTGLGLAIVRNVARAHGGDVSVNSTPGSGTTFTVRLPAATPTDDTKLEDKS